MLNNTRFSPSFAPWKFENLLSQKENILLKQPSFFRGEHVGVVEFKKMPR